jgi:hypothetical protein
MSSASLEPIIHKFPDQRKLVTRLASLLREATQDASPKGPQPEFTFEHLMHQTQPSSAEVLSVILSELVSEGILRKVVRVESPYSHGGIADYPSLTAVPSEVFDWSTDKQLVVQPENLRVIFKLQHG